MKKLIIYVCLTITLSITLMTNVKAYNGTCEIIGSSSGNNGTSKAFKTFELKMAQDNEHDGCRVRIEVEPNGNAKLTYTPYSGSAKQLGDNETSFKCSDNTGSFTIKLNTSLKNGLDYKSLIDNAHCKMTGYDSFEIYGLTKYTNGSGEIECAKQEFKINENQDNEKICKVQFSSDKDGNITFKYGEKTITSPDIKSGKLSCEVGGDSTFIYLPNRSYDKGSIKSYDDCPKVTSDSPEDSNPAADPDNDPSKEYDHGLKDLISEWFSKDNDGNMNPGEMDCNQVIQGKLGDYLTKIFSIMKYLGIVLCVGMTIYDFVKALLESDKEIMNKLVKKAFTRLILVAVLFFLPTFVNLIIKLFVDNPCEIKF